MHIIIMSVFISSLREKHVPDVGIELGAACMPSELASDRATAPGSHIFMAILPLPLIQEEQLSVTGERMCTKYW